MIYFNQEDLPKALELVRQEKKPNRYVFVMFDSEDLPIEGDSIQVGDNLVAEFRKNPDEEKQALKDILKTIVVAIADGSIISNAEDYADMIDKEL